MQTFIFAFLAIVSYAASLLVLRATLEVWPMGLAGVFSRVVSISLLAAWVLGTGNGWRRLLPRGTGKWLMLMGLISITINLLWFSAASLTTATNVALLFRLDLVFVLLIGGMLGLERIKPVILPLLAVMLVGLGLFTEIQRFNWGGHLVGDAMVIFAAFGLAANAFVIRYIMRKMDEEAVALYNHSISIFGFLVLALAGGEFHELQFYSRPLNDWLWIVFLGVLLAVGLPLYYAALRRMEVWKLRTFLLTAPLMVAVLELPLWGIHFSTQQYVGAAMILGGLLLFVQLDSRSQSEPCEPIEP
ncbi:MAG: DMT family transporter [Pirellulales bacterium]|nr:DMT family transporter [Pirellulales bacterium]